MSADQHDTSIRQRARELGIHLGTMPHGKHNAITDVPGVLVGHTTLISGDGPLVPGQGPVRTGVTAILPHGGNLFLEKVPAAIHVINGFGKCMGQEQVDELGNLEGPIALTGTMNVGLVTDAVIAYGIRENPGIGIDTSTINPVVGECSDSYLNDMQGRHVREEHVLAAIDSASSGVVAEGTVGAGTGMSAFGFKGGIGTASRVVDQGWTVGVLVLANFGRKSQLTIDGVPVGRRLSAVVEEPPERGSIMFVVATDAPLLDRGLRRIARRCAIGLGRTGSISGHGSGDYVIAFSSAPEVRIPHEPESATMTTEIVLDSGQTIDDLFQATVEATEEAIINALFGATTLRGRDDNLREALPVERVLQIMKTAGRIG